MIVMTMEERALRLLEIEQQLDRADCEYGPEASVAADRTRYHLILEHREHVEHLHRQLDYLHDRYNEDLPPEEALDKDRGWRYRDVGWKLVNLGEAIREQRRSGPLDIDTVTEILNRLEELEGLLPGGTPAVED